MKALLTDKMISGVQPPPARVQLEIWDAITPNLYLRVSPAGRKTWMRRLYRDGKLVREAFAVWPEMRVPEARDALLHDPTQADYTTFGAICEKFLGDATLAESTRKEWSRLIRLELEPLSGLNPSDADAFRKAARGLLEKIAKRSRFTRNRTFEVARRVYGWGVGQDLIRPAPVFAGFEKLAEPPRERSFSDDELKALLAACDLDYPEWRAYWKMLWLTGARRGSVLAAKWKEIDGTNWTIPSGNLKGRFGVRRDTVVPIIPELTRALDLQRQLTGHLEHVISNLRSESGVVNPQKAANRIRERSGVDDWHVHDIRHAVSTGLAKLRVEPHVIDRVLHHVSGSRIHRTYNAWEYFDEKRAALEKWAGYLDSLRERHPCS